MSCYQVFIWWMFKGEYKLCGCGLWEDFLLGNVGNDLRAHKARKKTPTRPIYIDKEPLAFSRPPVYALMENPLMFSPARLYMNKEPLTFSKEPVTFLNTSGEPQDPYICLVLLLKGNPVGVFGQKRRIVVF